MSDRRVAVAGLLLVLTGCSGTPSSPDEAGGTPAGDRAGTASGPSTSDPSASSAGARPVDDALEPALDGKPAAPESPREAAEQIEAADRVVRDPASRPTLIAAAGHTQQLAYRAVADRPGWDQRVEELLPAALRRDTRANVAARRAFRSMHPTRPADLATELPAWRIVRPPPAAQLRGWYREAERRYGVDWEYLAAINLVETGFGRIDGTSVAGAQGPMQFIPTTWDIYGAGGDIHDPHDAILAAGRLLRANGFGRDPAGALRSYNNSSAYVRGVTLYAEVMQRRPRTFLAYHQWPIYYLTRAGSVWLPEGYSERRPVPVTEYLRDGEARPTG